MKVQLRFFLIALAIVSGPARAFDEYYSIDRSIRAMGMGGAFYAVSDDEYALFYNPAGLTQYRGEPKLMFGLGLGASTNAFSEIGNVATAASKANGSLINITNTLAGYAGQPVYANVDLMPVYYVRKNFAIALLVANTKVQAGLLGRDFDTSVDVTGISDSGIVVGYARNLTENLHVGVNLKGIFRAGGHKAYSILDIAEQSNISTNLSDLGGAGFGIDGDIGAIYDLQDLPFGLKNQVALVFDNMAASNFGILRIQGGGAPPGLSREVSLGWHSVFPGFGIIDNFNLAVDFAEFGLGGETNPDYGARVGDFFKHFNWGVEAPMNGWFVLRAGFYQGGFTAGIGVRTSVVDFDIATYDEQLFTGLDRLDSRRVALRLAFGFGAPPPPPIYPKPSPQLGAAAERMRKEKEAQKELEATENSLLGPDPFSSSPKKNEPEPKPVVIDSSKTGGPGSLSK